MKPYYALLVLTAALMGLVSQASVRAGEQMDYSIEMKNGAFSPSALQVPAYKKIHLTVRNSEAAQTEFESYELNQEHKIESGKTADMFIGPLEPGTYPIFDDNNPDVRGSVIAK